MKYYLFFVVVAAGCLAAGCSNSSDMVKRTGQPGYVRAGYDEKLMERAIQKAKDTHQEFVAALATRSSGTSAYAIKKPFGPEREHIWLNDVAWNGHSFSAKVNNEPVDTKVVKLGDRVEVKPEELSDWMYVDQGVLKGGYTIRVLHYGSPPEVQKEMLKHVPFSIPAIDF